MDISAEHLVAVFGHRQLAQSIQAGAGLGLAPITTAATIMQISAMTLAQVAPGQTVALMRAYADVIEAGPGDGAAQAGARGRFDIAAQALAAAAIAARDFPTPQGRA